MPASSAPVSWPESFRQAWRVDVGEGYSSPVVFSGRAFVHSRRDPDESVAAIELMSGKILWQEKYPAPFEKNQYALRIAKGPHATPLVHGNRLFTLGATAIFSAWDTSTGHRHWSKHFSKAVDTSKMFCGTAASPLATGGHVVVQVGSDVQGGQIIALDPATGLDDPIAEARLVDTLKRDSSAVVIDKFVELDLVKAGHTIFVEDNSGLVYFVKWKDAEISPDLHCIGIAVWRRVGTPPGIGRHVFWQHLFPVCGTITTDAEQTAKGEYYWPDRIQEALDRGLFVYRLNLVQKTHSRICSLAENQQWQRIACDDQPKREEERVSQPLLHQKVGRQSR